MRRHHVGTMPAATMFATVPAATMSATVPAATTLPAATVSAATVSAATVSAATALASASSVIRGTTRSSIAATQAPVVNTGLAALRDWARRTPAVG